MGRDLQGCEEALAGSSHARFHSVALHLLVPCITLVLSGCNPPSGASQRPAGSSLIADMQARGRSYALLGAARLALAAPAAGTDPAMKFALKKRHLMAHQQHELQPEIEVRAAAATCECPASCSRRPRLVRSAITRG